MRTICAFALVALVTTMMSAFGRLADAQSPTPSPATGPAQPGPLGRMPPSLLCTLAPDAPTRLACRNSVTATTPSLQDRLKKTVDPSTAFVSSSSLWVANNLATPETTTRFLRGVTGSQSLAQKIAPAAMRISKSLPARAGLAVAILASGGVALYEGLFSDDAAAAGKPGRDASSKPVEMRLICVFEKDGTFRGSLPASATVPNPAAKQSP